MDVYIGLDIGTTNTKAVAFNRSGQSCGEHAVAYPILSETAGWAEQEPEAILAAVLECLGQVLNQMRERENRVAAVGLSTAMHAVLAMDASDQFLTRFIIWADNRSVVQAARLADNGTGYAVYRRTGTQIHAMSPLTKLMWFREQQPDVFQRTNKWLSLKDFIAYHLFGQFVTDYAIASATGLFRSDQMDWDEEALALAGVERGQLPELKPPTYVLRGIRESYAKQLGLADNEDLPFVLGASDGVLANLGVGAIQPGEFAVTIGTSGAVRTVIDRPVTDTRQRTFCYALTENHWAIGGANNNGAIVLQWLGALFSTETEPGTDEIEHLLSSAESIPAGSNGLLFLPYLSGERAPIWNPNARGVFFGLDLSHKQAHMVRAAMEGMMFSIRSIIQAVEDTCQSTGVSAGADQVLVSGGFAKSAFLRQMLADVLGKTVLVPRSYEASAFGAAVMAMVALGELADLSDVKKMIQIQQAHHPNEHRSKVYEQLFPMYEQLYLSLKPNFDQLAKAGL